MFDYIESKMASEFYSSKSCISFVKEFCKTLSIGILEKVEKNIEEHQDIQRAQDLISILKSDIKNQEKCKGKLVIYEEMYGKMHYEKMSINKSLYYIDIYSIISNYLSNNSLKSLIKKNYSSHDPNIMVSYFDGEHYKQESETLDPEIMHIYISIYADEINLANAIGNH